MPTNAEVQRRLLASRLRGVVWRPILVAPDGSEAGMELGLQGKGAVVTGGSRGIGRAIALAFADEGANVAICARGSNDLDVTAAELAERGSKVHAQTCDIADPDQLRAFLDDSHAALGAVHVLVNNASGARGTDDESGWRASIQVDLMASVRATWQVVPWIEEAGGGSVIHISSISALEAGSPPAYAAAKAALVSHSKTLAANLAGRGIRVNCILPGSIDFPGGFWDRCKRDQPDLYAQTVESIPWGRLGRPEEVANAVVFLASERASWISGIRLSVDGVQFSGN